jgi:guanylate kinase
VVIVISGPGGVGKGTVVKRLVERDPSLWLSRSWTTRARRPGEPTSAYTFVPRAEFEANAAAGGFLEHAEFLGHRYGTPYPDDQLARAGRDLVLEIDVQGAAQVVEREPAALLLFVTAPSLDEQEARLRKRGDPDDKVAQRLAVTRAEIAAAERLGARFVVNDDVDRTVDELLAIIGEARSAGGS